MLRACPVDETRALGAGARGERDHRRRPRPPRLRRPRSRGAFLAGEQAPHDPFLLGDMREAVERIRARDRARRAHLRSRRLRRRRHLRHRAGGVDAARSRCGRRLAPAEQVRGGLRRLGRDDRAARARTASVSSSPSTVGSRPSRRSPTPRRWGSTSSSRITTGPARRCPTAPSSQRGRRSIRSRSSAARASC